MTATDPKPSAIPIPIPIPTQVAAWTMACMTLSVILQVIAGQSYGHNAGVGEAVRYSKFRDEVLDVPSEAGTELLDVDIVYFSLERVTRRKDVCLTSGSTQLCVGPFPLFGVVTDPTSLCCSLDVPNNVGHLPGYSAMAARP